MKRLLNSLIGIKSCALFGLSTEEICEQKRLLEKLFPGKGELVLEILLPFLSKSSLKLQPAMPELEIIAKRAIFWQKINEVEIVTKKDLKNIKSYEIHWLSHLFDFAPRKEYSASRAGIWRRFENEVFKYSPDNSPIGLILKQLSYPHDIHIALSFKSTLCYAIEFSEDFDKDFGLLLKLWRYGNWPIGVSEKDRSRLYVLCSEK